MSLSEPRYLFLDDRVVAQSYKASRVYHQPLKLGANPVLSATRGCSAGAPATVWLEDGSFRMWYSVWRPRGPMESRLAGVGLATSRDGVDWDLPDTGSGEAQTDRPHNLVLWEAFPGGVYNATVMRRQEADDGLGQYLMLYVNIGRPGAARGMCAAYSPDGVHWQPARQNPVWQTPADHTADELGFGTGDDVVTGHYDPAARQYVAFRRVMHDEHPVFRPGMDEGYAPDTNNFVRVQARATSRDGLAWTDHRVVLRPDLDDAWDTEYYGLHAFPYGGAYLGFLTVYHTDTLTVDIRLCHSADGVQWQTASRQPFIARGGEGAFDHQIAWFACPPIEYGDELLIYYGGGDYPHSLEDEHWGDSGMGLARLRRDGFASLYSNKAGAHVTTQPLTVSGARLLVNAEARHGRLEVEALDPDGQVLPGFGRAESRVDFRRAPYRAALGQAEGGDSVRAHAAWSGGSLADLRGRSIRLRFWLQHCHLYSFAFTDGVDVANLQ